MRRLLVLAVFCTGVVAQAERAAVPLPGPGGSGRSQPNIILILADDFGWADTTLGGSRYYRTPNLERLAQQGVYFPNAYTASPLCSPTRASIMTGQSPARTGLTAPVCHLGSLVLKPACGDSSKPTDRQVNCTSITRLPTEHYTLAEVLKEGGYVTGHFGKWHLGAEPYSPLQHGFDVDIPHWPGPGPAGSFVAPWKYPDFKENYPKEHIEDRMGDEAVKFIEANARSAEPGQSGKPFFLNYWQFSVHAPFDAKQELIDKYRAIRDPEDPQQSPTYAAMVHSLDDNVGKILDALERLQLQRTTVVIFYSDNGGNMYDVVDGGTATSNRPLRGGKATIYEGGIRVPAIVCWPGVIKGGTVNNALVQSEDLYPTILEMAGVPVRSEQALDAVSMVPALKMGKGLREMVFSYFPHSPAVPEWSPPSVCVRRGDWKLIRMFHENAAGGHRYELYNLAEDIGERRNLAAAQPERVESMDAAIENFLQETGAVVPARNVKYDPDAADAVRNWKAAGGARLTLAKEMYHLRSFSATPAMVCERKLKLPAGNYSLALRIRSWAQGPARLSWGDSNRRQAGEGGLGTLGRDTSSDEPLAPIEFTADGLWHECRSDFEVKGAADTMRIHPASGEGSVYIAWMRLFDAQGKLLEEWDPAKKPESERPVGGWTGGADGDARLSAGKGTLDIAIRGGDPKLMSGALTLPAGDYLFSLRMKSGAGGEGLLFARPASRGYLPGSGTPFPVVHDNQWQEISVPLKRDHPIHELRLDPCTQKGAVQIDWIRLTNSDGEIVKEWSF